MSYLFGGESRQSRYQTAQDLSESSFKPDDFEPTLGESLGVGNDDTYLDKVTQAYTTPARLLTRSVANLGIAADAIPTALGTYYGVDNPWWHKHVTESLIHTSEYLTPDPKTTHVSLQIADQFAGMFSDVLLTMGNPAAFSAMQGGKRVTEELNKGKDLGTSLQLGAVDTLVSKAFMTVPVGYASKALPIANRLQGAVSGAGIGTVIGSAGELANQQVLESAGLPEEAQQHDWSNPQSLALNAAFGAAFGAWHPKILSSHKDALLTVNEAHAIEHPDGLSATNPAANNALVDGMNSAVHALANGEPVTSSLKSAEGFIHDPAKGELELQIAQHIADQHKENNQQAVDEFNQDYPDIVNGIVDKHYRSLITEISDQAGWSQKGGELLRDVNGNASGRTSWLPRQEWFGRFVAEGMGNQATLRKAVDKFISGEKLGPKQKQAIEWLKGEVDGKNQEGDPDSFTVTTTHDDLNNRILEHIETIQERRRQEHSEKNGQFIYDDVISQLEAAGHYDAEKNSAFARLHQIVFVNQAKEAGMSPRAFRERYGETWIEAGGDEDLSDAFGQGKPVANTTELGDFKTGVPVSFDYSHNTGNFDGTDANILHQSTKGAFHPDNMTISLFKSADASTFLHESGHQFLELYNNMIGMSDASPVIKADFDKLLSWFGVKDHNEWQSMTLDQQRPYHEQFAKGFETYLAEGKAPTPELQGLFKNFAQWLKQVYSDVQGKLGVKLTEEVRGVMDRIIHHGESEPMKSDTPETIAARAIITSRPSDKVFEIENDDGTFATGSAAELMARADEEAAFAEQSDTATSAAISCFLKFGDL